MMLTTQIRLTSAFLGELKKDGRGVRKFRMNNHQQVAINREQWLTALSVAARDLRLGIDVRRTIVPPDGIIPATICLYRRTYSKVYVELFESFQPNTILTFQMQVDDSLPRHPDLEQLAGLMRFVGQHQGISQFGSKFGFGRFLLLSITHVDPAVFVKSDEPIPYQSVGAGGQEHPAQTHGDSSDPRSSGAAAQ